MPTASEGQTAYPPVPTPPAPLSGRLHPAAIFLAPLQQVRTLIALIVTGSFIPEVAGVFVALAAMGSLLVWLRFRWQLTEGTLVIDQGLLERRRRIIPFERIQTVELVRPLGHRLLGVVRVQIEAVGGSKAEGRLDALDPATAERLRAVLLGHDNATPAFDHRDFLARLAPATLVLAGLTGGRVGVLAVFLGAADEFFGDRFEQLFDLPTRLGVRGTILLMALVAVAAFAISVAATVVAYWDFTLTREDGALLVQRGLFEQRLDTVPLRRIQALIVEENAVRRLLGRATVRVEVAGRSGAEAQQTSVLLPLGQRDEALRLVERVLGVEGVAGVPLDPMPVRARTRRIVRASVTAVVIAVAGVVGIGAPGLLGLALLVPLVAWALAAYRALGHAEHDGIVIVARAGVLVRRTSFVPIARVQSLELRASPFQRRARLATLALQIPRSSTSRDPRLHDLDRDTGEHLLRRLADAIPAD